MSEFECAPPPADALSESLRGFGYSIETAIADIIDNSITAHADNVWLKVSLSGGDQFVRILDDGDGMGEDELRAAMRLGSQNPLIERREDDLGRFGLGLKTASFSQARSLTVASRKDGATHVRRWDLDYLADAKGEWRLLTTADDSAAQHIAELDELDHGTMVLWQKLDRVRPRGSESAGARPTAIIMEQIERHLGMVFQRYLAAPSPRLKIHVNEARVRAWDPFLEKHSATRISPTQKIGSGPEEIGVKGFILPNKDMMTADEFDDAGGVEGWVSQQGFYIYRNDRLLVAGGWLGLGLGRPWVKDETHKLARIRLDLPNSVDEAWQIDVKKSDASPPAAIRNQLRDLALKVRTDARSIFVHRGNYGKRPPAPDLKRPWKSVKIGGHAAYRVDRSHPVAEYILASLDDDDRSIESFFKMLEQTVPVEKIWIDTVEQGELPASPMSGETRENIRSLARDLLGTLARGGNDEASAREKLKRLSPFDQFPDIIDEI
ncbi:ATP-binding protein [Sphingomicrobium clamense]|uniref:ATP-binding protein n=1 Tax=Sphingomicrobium clamense TaxID=2851013 RepID=A0ABS6V8T5_9SPHN|nr:ATP-binding protein [Sphingomicrobium sp. B8]MBW0145775.1 ATP-binding protein [Sphingomicrobium sp. B8]